ncbi:MAG: hypothetical protein K0R00_860 [Herbinix sp.]|jgi:putative membrane protein (TIGR04086 family)|nr:hypothetical protein [Herbinix sp.]
MEKVLRQNTKTVVIIKGLLLSYIITAFLLLLLALLMLQLDLPSAVISGGITLSYILPAFIGGFFTGKKLEQKKFIWGLVMGVSYFLIVLLVCLILNSVSPIPMGGLLTVFIICGLSGMLGGMLS